MKKIILLDFDGTIIDSQKITNDHIKLVLKNKKLDLKEEELALLNGMSTDDFTSWLNNEKNANIKEKELITPDEELEKMKLFSDSKPTIKKLFEQGYTLAIVTNAPRWYVKRMIKKYDIEKYFSTIITEDEAKIPKPDPTMLKLACKNLSVKPEDCIMIDDNEPGIIAGINVGAKTIRIQREKEEKESKADICVSTLSEIIPFIHQ